MEKVKKFIILPVGLFALNYFLGFYRNPWRFFFIFMKSVQTKTILILVNLLGCAAYIFLIAFLFVYVFTNENLKVLLKKSTLKMLGIVFAAELTLKFLFDIIKSHLNQSFLEAAKHGVKPPEWYSSSVMLSGSIVHFAVLYLTLRLLIKSLNLGFAFRKWAFFDTIVFYFAVNYLNDRIMLQLFDSLVFTLTTVTISGMTMSMDVFNIVTLVGQNLVVLFLDLLIFEYVNRGIKDRSESVLAENTNL